MLIEEVRRRPPGRSATVVPSDAAPFRPERHDEACRDRTRTSPAAPAAATVAATAPTHAAGGAIAPSHASNSRLAAALGAEAAGSTHTPVIVEQQQQQQQAGSQVATGGRRWAEGGDDFEPPALAESLPPAGLRATLARRLVNPVAKKRRLGDSSRGGRGGGGSGAGDGGVVNLADSDARLFGRSGVDTEPVGGVNDNPNNDDAGLAGGGTIAPGPNEEGATDLPPLGATAPPGSSLHSGKATTSAVAADGGGSGGPDPRVPSAAKSASGEGILLPHIAASNGSRQSPEEGAGDRTVRRRGAVGGGAGPWAGITNFADMNDDDESVSPAGSM